MISLFSVNTVSVELIFVLFSHAYVAGLDKACFDLACIHIKPQAWSRGLLFVCLMGEGYSFRFLCTFFETLESLVFSNAANIKSQPMCKLAWV